MEILDIYKSILKYASLECDKNGFIYTTVGGNERKPVMLDGKQLVLPTDNHLKTANTSEKIIFHPLMENILRGESDVLCRFREAINIRLNYTFGILFQQLLSLIGSTEYHSRLTPEQSELLYAVSEVDETTVSNFTKIMIAACKESYDRAFVNIYLNRGGVINHKKFSRTGVVSFPFWKELEANHQDDTGKPVVYGVKIRVKDREAFKKLCQFMFTKINELNAYSYGSDVNTAPFLDALMKASGLVASRLNDLIESYAEFVDCADSLLFDAEWVDAFENLDILLPEIRRIPMQHGNEGKAKLADSVGQVEAASPPPQATVQQPYVQPGPSYPVPQPPVQQPQMPQGYPPAYGQPPVYQQPMSGKPQIRETKRGIDFLSLRQADPTIAMGPNPLAPYLQPPMYPGMMMQQAPMERPPSWAPNPMNVMPMQYPYGQMPVNQFGGYPQQQFGGYPQQQPMGQMGYGYPQNFQNSI